MVEVDRLTYLKAMGITNYMPRWQLPGAPKPVLCQGLPASAAPAPPPESKETAINDSVSRDNRPPGQAIPSSLTTSELAAAVARTTQEDQPFGANQELKAPPITPADFSQALNHPSPAPESIPRSTPQPQTKEQPSQKTHTKEAKIPPAAHNATQLVKFSLSFWRVSEELLVVDSRHSELALPTEKLLANLLFALGLPRDLPKPEVVQWPMIDAHHQDQGDTAARETLNAFLDAQFLLNPGKYLLLMGREASHFILDTGKPYSAMLGYRFPVDEFNLTAIVIPSLAEMLQEPAQKNLTWNTVKFLRR